MQTIFSKLSVTTLVLTTLISNHAIANSMTSHAHDCNSELNITDVKKRINSSDNLCIDKEEELAMVDELNDFELGKFLLTNARFNGYWLSYLIHEAPKKNLDNKLENWMINEAPAVKATQERSKIFQQQINKYIRTGSIVASAPCGTMDDLHALNFEGIYDVKLVGIDLDSESIKLAKERYTPSKLYSAEFKQKDAWHLDETEQYNLMVSNGLNIYEHDDNKVVDLYSQFNRALTSGGVLITSFLTPSPEMSAKSTWKNYDSKNALKQKALFKDIIKAKWQTFRTEDQTRDQLEKAGFKVIEVIYDTQGMFPTVVARKI